MNPELGEYFGTDEGVLVISSPADAGLGLKGGDVVLAVDGRKPAGPSHLLRILRSYESGESFKLDILRNRKRETVTARLGERQPGRGALASGFAGRPRRPPVRPLTDVHPGVSLYVRPTLEGTMGFLWTLIIGLVVGAIAKLLMPGRDPGRDHRHHAAGRRRRPAGRIPRPGAGLVQRSGQGPGIIASIIGALAACCCSTGSSWGGAEPRFRKVGQTDGRVARQFATPPASFLTGVTSEARDLLTRVE